jgi:hypothetical protein
MKLKKAQVRKVLELTFPEYRGRKFNLEFTNEVRFWDTNWGGGTRNVYKAVSSDGRVASQSIPAPWVNQTEGSTYEIPLDVLVVKHTIYCGKDLGITIYANPVHQPKWLEATK